LTVTMTAIASQSAGASDWRRTMRPVSAANTGLTLMKTPKNRAGTRRSACRSAIIGTAEHKMPAVAARPSAAPVTAWPLSAQMPTGMYRSADRPAAAAGP
jgi:hypothetical protein